MTLVPVLGDGGKAPVKIGIGWWVQVPYGEGVASHTGPEFCGGGSNNALNGGVVLKPSVPTKYYPTLRVLSKLKRKQGSTQAC